MALEFPIAIQTEKSHAGIPHRYLAISSLYCSIEKVLGHLHKHMSHQRLGSMTRRSTIARWTVCMTDGICPKVHYLGFAECLA